MAPRLSQERAALPSRGRQTKLATGMEKRQIGKSGRIQPDFEKRNIADPFARHVVGRMNAAQKGKTSRAPHQPQKVLVVELTCCPTRCAGCST